jgi:hypothetical protein
LPGKFAQVFSSARKNAPDREIRGIFHGFGKLSDCGSATLVFRRADGLAVDPVAQVSGSDRFSTPCG